MNVLIIPSWYSSPDGSVHGLFFREQAKSLQRAGIRVGIVYPECRSLRRFHIAALSESHFQNSAGEEDGIPTLRVHGWNVPPPRMGWRIWVSQVLCLVERYVSSYGTPDIIHAHSVRWAGIASMHAAARFNVPFVITEHSTIFRNPIPAWESALYEKPFQKADALLAVSSKLRDSIIPFVPKSRTILVVPNVVDTDLFTTAPRQGSESQPRVLCLCNLIKRKGVDVLLRAFREVVNQVPEATLEVGGDGPERSDLESLTRSLGILGNVRFLGKLDQTQVVDAMHRADLFVLPSYYETFGVVLIEAMATGLPVIATACGGPEGFITPEVGELVPPGDLSALAAAILKRIGAVAAAESVRIRNYALSHFGHVAIASRLLDIYRNVLADRMVIPV